MKNVEAVEAGRHSASGGHPGQYPTAFAALWPGGFLHLPRRVSPCPECDEASQIVHRTMKAMFHVPMLLLSASYGTQNQEA